MPPLACCTVAVRVTGEPRATEEADAEREVVVPTTDGFALTVRLKVALCTRSPLMAQRVTGMVCDEEVDEAVKVSTEKPLLRLGELNEAVTPAGSPETLRFTSLPKLNALTRTLAVVRPDDMEYEPLSTLTLKSG